MSRMKDADEFGNRMKAYEAAETSRMLDPRLPIYARIDGRGFSRFTRGMEKPFDARMTDAMIETARHLVEATQARIGYVQSDEISLVLMADTPESDVMFSGKVQKLVSVLASMAAAKFARICPEGFEDRLPAFDCRVLQLPDRIEAANMLLWRAMDCRRNAVSMVSQAYFSHRQLNGKRQSDMHEMLREKGVDFTSYPEENRLGMFLARRVVEITPDSVRRQVPSSVAEAILADGPVLRTVVRRIAMPAFADVANRAEVVFEGAEPFLFDSPEGRAYVEERYPEDHPRRLALATLAP
jgi:tRNA(His) 5'-end guanylyltransferase